MTTTLRHDPEIGRRKMLLSGVRGVGFDERCVLRELGDLGWRDGTCVVGVRTLAARMGCGDKKLRRVLHSLIAQGLIEPTDRTRADGSNASREYRIVWSAVERHQDPQMQIWREQSARQAKALPARHPGRGPLPKRTGRSESGSVSPDRENNNHPVSSVAAAVPSPSAPEPSSLSIEALVGEGFRQPEAVALARHGDAVVRNAIETAESHRGRLRNRRGFIASFIRGGWEPPESVAKKRADREAAKTAAVAAQAAQAERVRELQRLDAANEAHRRVVSEHARSLGDRFTAALDAALEQSNTFERDYIRRKIASGHDPAQIPAAIDLVWRAAGRPIPNPLEQDHHGPEPRHHDLYRRRPELSGLHPAAGGQSQRRT